MPTQSVRGTTLHYLESGNGPNLVLVHGFPLDARMWSAQIDALSSRYRVVAPDLFLEGGVVSPLSPRVGAALVVLAVAWRWKNPWLPFAVGMGSLWLIRTLVG